MSRYPKCQWFRFFWNSLLGIQTVHWMWICVFVIIILRYALVCVSTIWLKFIFFERSFDTMRIYSSKIRSFACSFIIRNRCAERTNGGGGRFGLAFQDNPFIGVAYEYWMNSTNFSIMKFPADESCVRLRARVFACVGWILFKNWMHTTIEMAWPLGMLNTSLWPQIPMEWHIPYTIFNDSKCHRNVNDINLVIYAAKRNRVFSSKSAHIVIAYFGTIVITPSTITIALPTAAVLSKRLALICQKWCMKWNQHNQYEHSSRNASSIKCQWNDCCAASLYLSLSTP